MKRAIKSTQVIMAADRFGSCKMQGAPADPCIISAFDSFGRSPTLTCCPPTLTCCGPSPSARPPRATAATLSVPLPPPYHAFVCVDKTSACFCCSTHQWQEHDPARPARPAYPKRGRLPRAPRDHAAACAGLGQPRGTGRTPDVPLTPGQGYVPLGGTGTGWVMDTRGFTPVLP